MSFGLKHPSTLNLCRVRGTHLLNVCAVLELSLPAWGRSEFYSRCFPFGGAHSGAGTAHGGQGEAPVKGHTLAWFMESHLHPNEMRSLIVGSHIIFMLSSVSLWVNML